MFSLAHIRTPQLYVRIADAAETSGVENPRALAAAHLSGGLATFHPSAHRR
jgi:hypothetical protein